ncbi:uncharacterized protein isoform X2 [Leptinotarsa decemlineata]|uniref:uncharacterized protein isoform X2 n=1 Tax=Leptinotarsa decemlineata TaxID=7539 RepID=UPI003D30B631
MIQNKMDKTENIMGDIDELKFYREKDFQGDISAKCEKIILEAKRVILKEHLEKVANYTLSAVDSKSKINVQPIRECKNYLDWKDEMIWKDLSNPKTKINNVDIPNSKTNQDENLHLLISSLLETDNTAVPKSCNSNCVSEEVMNLNKKYFNLWRKYVRTKNEKLAIVQEKINQEEKLENFIKNLKNTKNKRRYEYCDNNEVEDVVHYSNGAVFNTSLLEPCSNYKNRFKAQKNIIEMQKAKLEEQNKIINELKLGIIQEDLLQSIENTKVNIREIFSNCSEKMKCKAPIILIEKPNLKISSQKIPKVVQQMEQRALQRAQNRQIILQRKRLIEENRQRMLEEVIERKRALEEEEKKRNLEMLKERRRKELEIEKHRQANKQRYMDNVNRATKFYNKILVQQCFKKLYINFQKNKEKHLFACYYYDKILLKQSFGCWMNYIESLYVLKIEIADSQYEYKILKRAMAVWRQHCLESTRNMQAAEDLYDFRLISNTFINWNRYICKQFLVRDRNMKKAAKHYERILFHYFYQWKSLKAVNQLEKAKELKKRKWREKVWEILPDYLPVSDLSD